MPNRKEDIHPHKTKNSKDFKSTSNLSTSQNSQKGHCPSAAESTQPPSKICTPQATKNQQHLNKKNNETICSKTQIIIKYDAGYPNQIYIRGKGADLSWERGQPLRNIKPDEWIWETDTSGIDCEFKVLINDQIYEIGENHFLNAGSALCYTPNF